MKERSDDASIPRRQSDQPPTPAEVPATACRWRQACRRQAARPGLLDFLYCRHNKSLQGRVVCQ